MVPAPASLLPPRLAPAEVFRALADATRVRILHLLRDGPLCVGDLAAVLDLSQPKVSRHLAYLRRVRLVLDEKRGLWCFYRLAPAQAGFHRKLLELLDGAGAEIAEGGRDRAALRRIEIRGGCCPQHAHRPRGKR